MALPHIEPFMLYCVYLKSRVESVSFVAAFTSLGAARLHIKAIANNPDNYFIVEHDATMCCPI